MSIISEIIKLKSEGVMLSDIAKKLNIPVGTVKSKWFRYKEKISNKDRVDMNEDIKPNCKMCGKEIIRILGKKKREFCCDYCRVKYWRKHNNDRK